MRVDQLGPLGVMMKYNIKLPEYRLLQDLINRDLDGVLLALEVLMVFKVLDLKTAEAGLRDIQSNPME